MKFCTKCGTELQEGTLFCIKCGEPNSKQSTLIQQAAPIQQVEPAQSLPKNLPKPNIKLSKMQKTISLVVAIILVLCLLMYKAGEFLTSKDKVISEFTQALTSKDSSQLAKYIVSSDPKLKIDAKNLESLLIYLDKSPSYRNEIVKSINNQSINSALSNESEGMSDLFTLKKQGKTWILYDKYVLELKPVYINVYTNYKGTQIFLDNTLVCTADQNNFTKEIGPYLPGLYKMRAFLEGEYINLEETVDVDLLSNIDSLNSDQNIMNLDLYLNGYEVSVTSDYEDATLFVNGKSTGLSIKDAQKFGPVSKDGSVKMYAQKDFPWGTVKSEEFAIDGSSNISLKVIGINEDVKNTLMETINSYNKSSIDASKSRDISKISNVSEIMKDSINVNIQKMITNKRLFTGNMIKTVFDLDSITIYQRDNKYYAKASDIETYNSGWYDEGSEVPTPNLEELGWDYTLIYDETSKKWLIDNILKNYFSNAKNKKEFTF